MRAGTVHLKVDRLKFFVGLNTGYVTGGIPDKRLVEFYRRRCSVALHSAIVGNVVIPGGYACNPSTPIISRAPEWGIVATSIAKCGSLPGIQFATAWEGYVGSKNFRSPSGPMIISQSREVVSKFTPAEISSTFRALDEAVNLAVEAGFRHLQVHAAHGYLFSLLIDYRINDRASEVLENLARWASRCSGLDVETSIRISLKTGDDTFDYSGREKFYAQVVGLPFDFFDVSSGFYNIDKRLIYPSTPDMLAARRAETISLASRFPEKRFIFSGRALQKTDRGLPPNLHIGLCRDLIANPDYLMHPEKGCTNSGKCHYFSRGLDHITCPHWSEGW